MTAADQKHKAPDLAELLFNAAFGIARDPRSAEYKEGVHAVLKFQVGGTRMPRPYRMGTVQADAFYAGVDEGHQIWRRYEEHGLHSCEPVGEHDESIY